jgi:hypothetical protein
MLDGKLLISMPRTDLNLHLLDYRNRQRVSLLTYMFKDRHIQKGNQFPKTWLWRQDFTAKFGEELIVLERKATDVR